MSAAEEKGDEEIDLEEEDFEEDEVGVIRNIENRRKTYVDAGTKEKPFKWEPAEGQPVVIMKDAAKAAFNGAKKLWVGNDMVEGACAEHVFGRWSDKHQALIVAEDQPTRTKIRGIMRADFQALKGIPVLGLVDEGFIRMATKWRGVSDLFVRTFILLLVFFILIIFI